MALTGGRAHEKKMHSCSSGFWSSRGWCGACDSLCLTQTTAAILLFQCYVVILDRCWREIAAILRLDNEVQILIPRQIHLLKKMLSSHALRSLSETEQNNTLFQFAEIETALPIQAHATGLCRIDLTFVIRLLISQSISLPSAVGLK